MKKVQHRSFSDTAPSHQPYHIARFNPEIHFLNPIVGVLKCKLNIMAFKYNLFRGFSGYELLEYLRIIDRFNAQTFNIYSSFEQVRPAYNYIPSLEIKSKRTIICKKKGLSTLDIKDNYMPFEAFYLKVTPAFIVPVGRCAGKFGIITFNYKNTVCGDVIKGPANNKCRYIIIFLPGNIKCFYNYVDYCFLLFGDHSILKCKLHKLEEDYHPFFKE